MPAPLPTNDTKYINSGDFKTLENKLTDLKEILDDSTAKLSAFRKLRYAEVDVEGEREKGRIQPDEVYVPQHLIDTNIRQEQGSYIQFVAESPRAVICQDQQDSSVDLQLLEQDLTKKLRYDGWQLAMFANIDGFQQNAYGIMETVQDQNTPGGISREYVQFSDFGFINDTRNLQNVEMCARSFYFTKTQLVDLMTPKQGQNPEDVWDTIQVNKLTATEPSDTNINPDDYTEEKDRSLYRIQKVMFRIQGIVHVAWVCIGINDDWLRKPRPLFLGRRTLLQEHPLMAVARKLKGGPPPSKEAYETEYPFFLYQYLISENDTIAQLKGRSYLDQDTQEAVTSLLSSVCTQARRAAGMYFSKDTSDPNDDILIKKNVYFEQNCLINANVKAFKIDAPDPGIFSAIQTLATTKQVETSQVAFAVNNRKDSRKTKKELDLAEQSQQKLSTVQVVLFSIALRTQFQYETDIIKSRVLAGLVQVTPEVMQQYQRDFIVKPSGDVDVVEKQQMIEAMQNAWPIMQTTGAASLFLADLLEKMFPNNAAKYIQAIQQQTQQQQSAQAQQAQQMQMEMLKIAQGLIHLSKHPDYFSDTGRIHAFPVIKLTAEQLEPMVKQVQHPNKQPAQIAASASSI